VARPREGHDGALPSANAVAARALVRLGHHFERPDLAERARAALEADGAKIQRSPRAFATALGVLELLDQSPVELALIGASGSAEREALELALSLHYLPNRVVTHAETSALHDEELPLLRGKALVDGRAALYVCKNGVCKAPVTDPGEVPEALAR
jgi:uncharacterized protein YyaL (SSP411 family)